MQTRRSLSTIPSLLLRRPESASSSVACVTAQHLEGQAKSHVPSSKFPLMLALLLLALEYPRARSLFSAGAFVTCTLENYVPIP